MPMIWIVRGLHAASRRRVSKLTLIHYRRWQHVRIMRDTRPIDPFDIPKEIGYDQTFEWVAQRLANTWAAGSAKDSQAILLPRRE